MPGEAHGNFFGKHLIVFGCGDIGGEVARQALARGLRVTALTRNAESAVALHHSGIAVVEAELASSDWHDRVEGAADFVVNTVSAGGGGLDGYRRSYLDGMASILTWAEARNFSGTMAYTSSTSVYPQGGGVSVDELAPVSGRDERAAVLVEAERLLLAFNPDTSGNAPRARAVVLRLAGIYGPGRHHLLDQVRAGEVSGYGEHHLNLIHRDDVTAAIWAALGAAADVTERVFNVADDGAATKAEVVTWLARELGVAVPRFTGEAVGGRRTVTPDRVIANARIKNVLGWRPRFPSFREGYATLLSR